MKKKKYTGKNIGVAIIDTGIYEHMDFQGRIRCFQDFLNYRSLPYDDSGHGTHVAGILGGSGAASGGKYRGTAPQCDMIILKILDQYGNGSKENVLRAFRWIRNNKMKYHIRVVNISVGTTCRSPKDHLLLNSAAEQLWDEGLVIVAAAGNQGPEQGSITSPGSSRKVITVGSSDMLTGRSGVSGRGPTSECICKPDVVAPGNHIISCGIKGPDSYGIKSGTSMSTPRISGSVACMLEKDPMLTNLEIKMMLKESAVDLGLPHNQQGWGLFDEDRFLAL